MENTLPESKDLPISYIQGCLVKHSYNVPYNVLTGGSFISLFPNTAAHVACHQHSQRYQVREDKLFFFPAACVEEPPWHAAPLQVPPSTLSLRSKGP